MIRSIFNFLFGVTIFEGQKKEKQRNSIHEKSLLKYGGTEFLHTWGFGGTEFLHLKRKPDNLRKHLLQKHLLHFLQSLFINNHIFEF